MAKKKAAPATPKPKAAGSKKPTEKAPVAAKPRKRVSKAAAPAIVVAAPAPIVRKPDVESFVRVRMYRHGLGDCFLISFRRPEDTADPSYHILIDCGIIPGNPNATALIRQVVEDIYDTTKGKIDVLVATHEHADHVSGFNQAKDLFGEKVGGAFTFGRVWLAWTEDPKDPKAVGIRAERQRKLAALWMGVNAMKQRLKALGADEESSADFQRAAEVLSFFGINSDDAPHPSQGLGAAAKQVETAQTADSGGPIAQAMKWVQGRGVREAEFWSPGSVFPLEGVEDTRVFVLGPPKDLVQLHKDLPSSSTKKPKETYEDKAEGEAVAEATTRAFGLGATTRARAFLAAAFGAVATGPDPRIDLSADRAIPFDRKYQIPWKRAAELEFFQDHYFRDGGCRAGEAPGQGQDWRRIDGEWAAGSAAFAMQLDGDTNNTSLALAFELPGGHVLLFPGDAQVGNWESWHADSNDKALEFKEAAGNVVKDATDDPVNAEDLLNRVIFYKVGHHGSHNATLREKGLEMMTRPGLTAAIPVDAYVAHVKKRWKKMPFNPLTDRLAEITKSGGLVVQLDSEVPGRSKVVASEGVTVTVEDSTVEFADDFDVEGQDGKVKRKLYVDYRIRLG